LQSQKHNNNDKVLKFHQNLQRKETTHLIKFKDFQSIELKQKLKIARKPYDQTTKKS
jgi:hypothetical protein